MSIRIENLEKHFGSFHALKNINLQFRQNQLTSLLGPSGCGKTTLLRIIAGLEFADSGRILFEERDVTNLSAKDRGVGFVFQNYALFQNMTVFDNIAFGLRVKPRKTRPSEAKIHEKVTALLKLIELEWLAQAYPNQLSGGQRQRVALARSLAVQPKVLLLDEPFGALDAQVRKTLRRWLRDLHQELNVTSIFVTHDQDEALDVSDRIVVMNKGQIEQIDEPNQIYHAPQTPFVTQFVGDVNVFHGHIDEGKLVVGEFSHHINTHTNTTKPVNNQSATAYIRPYELTLSRSPENALATGKITHINAIGFIVRIEIESAQSEQPIEVILTKNAYNSANYQLNEQVYLVPDKLNLFQQMNI
ncbi:sulfate ABC transporter ATP-binding protein [Bisgaard Taxon 10/6]|uniref:Sulfate ABC transporter ATP-binding protein n=1 Tax=Exercitatus varius TaxID=67857 RepID=A0AAW6QBM8_9PAST|nr:sulfate ABC transporter ATP-binding protein [Exercitatus varius]MDG2918052.1 sulfate ABC transporter ATP-binding protein [Exercitatus varius]MDG2939093.1 sulfate ABC transporter ATP-binding protein [Exercitatus varius]MDG2945710.1 sulfate ABC transporter ATP-binding protein [Exercitatus varius]MDG2949580.1 sulfate ABC transporter ATP-binding protein [Exercitatus varius]MDG2952050.1 sulfate ABC transporter ATP-binding protein [Exercitatus varius]